MIVLHGQDFVAVYLLLLKNESSLDKNQVHVKHRMEKILFERLSIEEIESIEDLYKKNVDVLGKKS